ncbi:hypothetical protein MFLAVUS_007246 [Mucor flavus]|uniref:Grh/CP2 DB domain-containing protein n=1 Tax=Mucor flavus TaxID=439312 RepID=A0ABP9Z3S3_9FUNG
MDEQHHQQQHHANLTFRNPDWSFSKSPQPSFIPQRDDLYAPMNGPATVAPSYSTYEGYEHFPDDITSTIHHSETVYQPTMSWSTTDDNHMANMMVATSTPTTKLSNQFSSDFLLHNRKPQLNQGNLMSIFPSPPPPPPSHHQTAINMFGQKPSLTTPYINKGEKYHPRFKSANARLSPFTEQQEIYQQFLSSSSSSSPPQHSHLIKQEEMMVVEEENNIKDLSNSMDSRQQYYQAYQDDKEFNQISIEQTKLSQFNAILHASTAVKKKHDEQPVTYLNRGQAYLLDLSATSQQENHQYPTNTMTSTISIAFHEPSHRQIAESYWKYWISQQEIPKEARAIDLDTNQTTGIYNIRLISFDRISFDWHSRFGAKIYVRFNCLSTDFSRIKGVKGIPLRCVMETNMNYMSLPEDSMLYRGSFEKISSCKQDVFQYKEFSYCKIKLFRDKGAERKNKDDKKQIDKQKEKIIASTNGNPHQHPLWPMISQTYQSTSILTEIPSSPDTMMEDFDESEAATNLINMIASSTNGSTQSKRKREMKGVTKKSSSMRMSDKKSRSKLLTSAPSTLCFYVWTRHQFNTPHEVYLENLTTYDLKIKLSAILSIHPAKIAEILWRRKKTNVDFNSDVLVLVEDTFITEHIADGEIMTVDLEAKTDGNFRLIIEF